MTELNSENKNSALTIAPSDENSTELAKTDLNGVSSDILKQESLQIINKVLLEQNADKIKDLSYLYNINQNKKNMLRNNKLNDLLDVVIKQTLDRFTAHPEEFANKELLDALKVIQESIEKNQKQMLSDATETKPLIQINQQEVNIGDVGAKMDRSSKERVQRAVEKYLQSLNLTNAATTVQPTEEIIEEDE